MRNFEVPQTTEIFEAIPGKVGLSIATERLELNPEIVGTELSSLDHISTYFDTDGLPAFVGVYVRAIDCDCFGYKYDVENNVVILPRSTVCLNEDEDFRSANEFNQTFLDRLISTNRIVKKRT